MMVFVHGAELFIEDESNKAESLVPNLSCDSASDQQDSQETRWTLGETFHKYVVLCLLSPISYLEVMALTFSPEDFHVTYLISLEKILC